MRAEIAASILSCDPSNFAGPVLEMIEGGTDWIHLDVMDGQFVPPITFGADLAARVVQLGSVPVEAHLMTCTPERHFESFVKAGCKRVTFHLEATHHAHRLCQSLHAMGVQAGVAINPGTPVSALECLSEVCDLFLLMTVNPGWGGQSFIAECLPKAAELRQMYPHHSIQADGGIDDQTIGRAKKAGFDVFVAGSYLVRGDSIKNRIMELRRRCH